jgi:diguanylate cyclase (GGDEF)-like protein
VAGDRLLRTVADCIRTCFATEDNDNCFRFGGDEFCAVLRGCDEAEVHERIDRFYDMLRSRRISVSVGYAYADSIDREGFKTLLDEADVRMYENKKRAHAMRSAS